MNSIISERGKELAESQLLFKKRIRNEARSGLSENFIKFLIGYHDFTEKYISEVEMENLRLHLKVNKLNKKSEAGVDAVSWLQSILIKQLKKFNNELRAIKERKTKG